MKKLLLRSLFVILLDGQILTGLGALAAGVAALVWSIRRRR
jgi:hypothetical protein